MNVKVGDKVQVIHHMSNQGAVQKVYYVSVTASTGPGPLSKRVRIVFESELDGKIYDMIGSDLRVVRE
jgi:hypothetical protein